MPIAGPHRRTLERALEIVGTRERLADALSIPVAELERYLGESSSPLPQEIFLRALDVVAHAPRGRRTSAG